MTGSAVDVAWSLALIAVVAGVATAYGRHLRRFGAAHHARVDRAGGSALLGKGPMEMGYWAMRPVARALVASGVGANGVSWASLALGAAAGAALATWHLGVGAALSVASSVCDALDGMVARETRTASDAGEVLDATVDRYVELFFLGGLAFGARRDPLVLALALGATSAAVMVSYATAKAEALRVEAPRGSMRRQERAVYLAAGVAFTPLAAAAVPSAWGAPAWVSEAPLIAALALVAAVGNASAVRRLAAVARAVRGASRPLSRETAAGDRIPGDAHVAAGDGFR